MGIILKIFQGNVFSLVQLIKVDFLRDETGGRRFWPMTVNPERVEVNWSKLTKDEIDQIWAEAKILL